MSYSAVYSAVENIRPLSRRDALWLADRNIGLVIDALRRDPAIPSRSFADWWLVLGDVRVRLAEQIATEINGHVDLGTVLNTIEAVFTDLELADA